MLMSRPQLPKWRVYGLSHFMTMVSAAIRCCRCRENQRFGCIHGDAAWRRILIHANDVQANSQNKNTTTDKNRTWQSVNLPNGCEASDFFCASFVNGRSRTKKWASKLIVRRNWIESLPKTALHPLHSIIEYDTSTLGLPSFRFVLTTSSMLAKRDTNGFCQCSL